MATKLDKDIAVKVIDRMINEGIGMVKISSLLAEIYPETSEDDIVIFLADYLRRGTNFNKLKFTKKKVPPFDSRSSSTDTCSGSSQDRGC
jgi:hypothetical protein